MLGTSGRGFGLRTGGYERKSVSEFGTEDDLRQLVVPLEPSPALLCILDELEHHGERCRFRETALGADDAVAHRQHIALQIAVTHDASTAIPVVANEIAFTASAGRRLVASDDQRYGERAKAAAEGVFGQAHAGGLLNNQPNRPGGCVLKTPQKGAHAAGCPGCTPALRSQSL